MSFSTINISISNEKDFSNIGMRGEKSFCKMRKSFLPPTYVKVYISLPCSLKRLRCFLKVFISHLNRVKTNVHYMYIFYVTLAVK